MIINLQGLRLKGSMTSEASISGLDYFAMFESPGPTLLISDGAKSHLDATIVDTTEKLYFASIVTPHMSCIPWLSQLFVSMKHFGTKIY